ncbi:MAG: hypothetical protein LBR90_04265 [Elusimicrobiota bacterium]|jgi:hypothetical protein|nr:hypothetical protein [Elusimicrobiota bacterium]
MKYLLSAVLAFMLITPAAAFQGEGMAKNFGFDAQKVNAEAAQNIKQTIDAKAARKAMEQRVNAAVNEFKIQLETAVNRYKISPGAPAYAQPNPEEDAYYRGRQPQRIAAALSAYDMIAFDETSAQMQHDALNKLLKANNAQNAKDGGKNDILRQTLAYDIASKLIFEGGLNLEQGKPAKYTDKDLSAMTFCAKQDKNAAESAKTFYMDCWYKLTPTMDREQRAHYPFKEDVLNAVIKATAALAKLNERQKPAEYTKHLENIAQILKFEN